MNPELIELLAAMMDDDSFAFSELKQTIELNSFLRQMGARHTIEKTIERSRNPQAAAFYDAIDRAAAEGTMQGYRLN